MRLPFRESAHSDLVLVSRKVFFCELSQRLVPPGFPEERNHSVDCYFPALSVEPPELDFQIALVRSIDVLGEELLCLLVLPSLNSLLSPEYKAAVLNVRRGDREYGFATSAPSQG
uniref:hypothetical protein n=1 Tax=Pseudomonas aeruginosa TaxID=287 RepID=UPI002355B88E|nr:hypothetical protein [Pseudomonas aeruginosa]